MSNRNGTHHNYDERSHRPRVRLTPIGEMQHGGAIKWFDEVRKYGFVEMDQGGDAFLHISVAKLYGLRPEVLIKGVRVRCDIREAPGRRPDVTAIGIA
jgi:cold shock CspA family protein